MTNTSARWLTVTALIIVVLGATYALYNRNREAVITETTTNIMPAAGPVDTSQVSSTAMPGAAPGSPYEISQTTSTTSGTMAPAAGGQ